jgi:hypothetical protein
LGKSKGKSKNHGANREKAKTNGDAEGNPSAGTSGQATKGLEIKRSKSKNISPRRHGDTEISRRKSLLGKSKGKSKNHGVKKEKAKTNGDAEFHGES